MTTHAFLAPSSAYRWGPGGCPASAHMEARFPEEGESEDARLGNAAHWFVAEALAGRTPVVDTAAPNGVPITGEIILNCQPYLRECQGLIADAAANGGYVGIESRVAMHKTVHSLNDGTPDFFAVWPALRKVRLVDFKYGHRYVDAFRNPQLADYFLGIFETCGLELAGSWDLQGVIHQPRNYHPEGPRRVWQPTAETLQRIAGEFREAAAAAVDPDAPCVTGDHCRDCVAAHACTALQTVGGYLVDLAARQLPHVPDNDNLGRELTALRKAMRRLATRAEALEEQALNRIAQGQRVIGWTGEHSSGRTVWNQPPAKIIAAAAMLGVDVAAPVAALTPRQAQLAGLDPDTVKAFSTTPRGAYTLVPVTPHSLAKGLSEHG